MQYSVCEKSPNSKIYNKLLFVVYLSMKSMGHTNFPIIFLQIVSGLMMERTSSLREKTFGKGYF